MKSCLLLRYLVLAWSVFTVESCKRAPVSPATTARQNSPVVALLDASGEALTTVADCGPSFANIEAVPVALLNLERAGVLKGQEGKPELRLALFDALAAVPRSLLQLFFINLHGEILLTDARKICNDTPLTQEERELLGGTTEINACWVADGKEPLRLVLGESPKLIRSALLRLFAYMYSEYFMARIQSTSPPAMFQEPAWRELTSSFTESTALLSEAFIFDIKSFGHKKIAIIEKMRLANPKNFANMVFANAVDSYYCSRDSNKAFASKFKLTYAVFTDASKPLSPFKVFGQSSW